MGQYNTLVKVLRDLKDSEAKLKVQAGQKSEVILLIYVCVHLGLQDHVLDS